MCSVWRIVALSKHRSSISTCWLNVSGISTFAWFFGPGFAQARHAWHVSTISGISCNVLSAIPPRWRKRVTVWVLLCHQRTWSSRRTVRRTASSVARRALTVRPISQRPQSRGCSGQVPVEVNFGLGGRARAAGLSSSSPKAVSSTAAGATPAPEEDKEEEDEEPRHLGARHLGARRP